MMHGVPSNAMSLVPAGALIKIAICASYTGGPAGNHSLPLFQMNNSGREGPLFFHHGMLSISKSLRSQRKFQNCASSSFLSSIALCQSEGRPSLKRLAVSPDFQSSSTFCQYLSHCFPHNSQGRGNLGLSCARIIRFARALADLTLTYSSLLPLMYSSIISRSSTFVCHSSHTIGTLISRK